MSLYPAPIASSHLERLVEWRAGSGAVSGFSRWLGMQLPAIRQLWHPVALGSLFAGLVVLGIGINWLSTYFVVRKYLKLREEDLYE
ncbi:MAG: hypothetical protein R2795_14505 [Saprospiraceae bacterium]